MIECVVRYYIKSPKSPQRRTVRFERVVKFPVVPFQGSMLELIDDNLEVERVIFPEESSPVLVIKTDGIEEADPDIESTIEDMKERGWSVASDTQSRKSSIVV